MTTERPRTSPPRRPKRHAALAARVLSAGLATSAAVGLIGVLADAEQPPTAASSPALAPAPAAVELQSGAAAGTSGDGAAPPIQPPVAGSTTAPAPAPPAPAQPAPPRVVATTAAPPAPTAVVTAPPVTAPPVTAPPVTAPAAATSGAS